MIPLVTPEVVPTQESVLMVLLKIFADVEEKIPTTLAKVVLVEDRVLMVLPLILMVVAGEVLEMPVTAPPVPVEDKPVMVFEAIVRVVIVPLMPCENPVIAPVPVILVMVLLDTFEVPP